MNIKLKTLLLLERLSPSDAKEIFKKYGIDPEGIPIEDLAKEYKKLVIKHHPDKGGKTDDMQNINAAWDVLKNISGDVSDDNFYNSASSNPRDINHILYKAWEMSGKPPKTEKNEYMFWNWDGTFFRGSFKVYAIQKTLFDISKLMVEWDDFDSKAVFYSMPEIKKTIFLVNLHGREVTPHKEYEHNSFNQNPGNDTRFVDYLRKNMW